MADGSFYEGSFENGEITGHGYRTWVHTKNSYTGQFERGEMCGSGVMLYGNDDKYEGGWQNNKREGIVLETKKMQHFPSKEKIIRQSKCSS